MLSSLVNNNALHHQDISLQTGEETVQKIDYKMEFDYNILYFVRKIELYLYNLLYIDQRLKKYSEQTFLISHCKLSVLKRRMRQFKKFFHISNLLQVKFDILKAYLEYDMQCLFIVHRFIICRSGTNGHRYLGLLLFFFSFK